MSTHPDPVVRPMRPQDAARIPSFEPDEGLEPTRMRVTPLPPRAVPAFEPSEVEPPRTPIPHLLAVKLVFFPLFAAVPLLILAVALQSSGVLALALLAVPVSFAGAVLGTVNFLRVLSRARESSASGFFGGLAVAALTTVAGVMASLSALAMTAGAGRGRQLRVRGKPQYAPLGDESPYLERAAHVTAEPSLAEVADAWRQNGKTEHASVAAFAELSMELVALGAPPALIEDAHRDALDELEHTKLCFELARSLDGRALGPEDFPAAAARSSLGPRALRLSALAVRSLFDGALYEGLSARVVASLTRTSLDDRVRGVLERIARDEARHAAHGFAVLEWCVEVGGEPVRGALEAACAQARAQAPHGLGGPLLADGRFERYGLPGRARELHHWAVIRDRTVSRVERVLREARA